MSRITEGSAPSLMVTPAVVWGTKTVMTPLNPGSAWLTAVWTRSLISTKTSRSGVRTEISSMEPAMFPRHLRRFAERLGGGKGTRTPGLRDANAPLSHLSYTPRRSPVFIAHGGRQRHLGAA